MDHFRIYRAILSDFDALGPVPYSLTQLQEWSEDDRHSAEVWEGCRKAKEAELNTGRYRIIEDELKLLNTQKKDLLRSEKSVEFENLATEVGD